MSWLTRIFGRRKREEDLRDEMRSHLEMAARAHVEQGVPPVEAQRAARREFGNAGLVAETTRDMWSWRWLREFAEDLRYGSRMLSRSPGFTAIAVLTLALGIGANTAIFSFMDALLVRSLPVADPSSLAVLKWHVAGKNNRHVSVVHDVSGFFYDDPKTGKTTRIFPYPAFELLRKSTEVFSVLFAYHPAEKLTAMVNGQSEVENGEYVSGDYFRGLEVAPASGRLIIDDDDLVGAPSVVVFSYALARERFGDAGRAAGQPVLINNLPFTVVGVTPPGFFGINPGKSPSFYLPLHADLLMDSDRDTKPNPGRRYLDEHYYWLEMMGRLRPGVTLAQAQAALAPVFEGWVAATAKTDAERNNLPQFLLQSGAAGLDNLRREYSQPLYVLSGMVGLILAIACANIANLLLARASARRREMAVRLSLGAARGRVIRQLLTESLLLAALGGTLGILFAFWGTRFLALLLANGSESFKLSANLNWHVLAATAGLTVFTGLLFGLAPALQATRVDVVPALKDAKSVERPHGRLRLSLSQALVVAQISISLSLLVGAGLFVRTLSNLQSLEMGFQRENLLLFKLNARQAGHNDPEILSFYRDLQNRFAAIPGVKAATIANSALIGEGAWGWPVVPIDKQIPANAPSGHGSGAGPETTRVLETGPGFFATMGIPLLQGREFDARDHVGSSPVAIVNEAWVRVNLENRSPIGQIVVSHGPGLAPRQIEVVGVVKNARYDDLTGEFPSIVYMPFAQNLSVPAGEMTFLLRTAGGPLNYANAVREIVHEADARIPVTDLGTQSGQIDREMNQEILFARLSAGFAVLALTIACVGLYGTMSYVVARRTGEIGIRMALGAQPLGIVRMVLSQVIGMAVVGLVIGVAAAPGLSRLVASLLYGIAPNDPAAVLVAVGTLVATALAAGYLPARRASRVDPMAALRHE